MRLKICGLFRDEDIDYVNEARPDYAGFVFAESKRRVTPVLAQYLRFRLVNSIIPVGIFVDARIAEITTLYQNGIISIAQLHGDEDDSYINALKKASGSKPIPIIKSIKINTLTTNQNELVPAVRTRTSIRNQSSSSSSSCGSWLKSLSTTADYLLIDSGAGSGKTFNWDILDSVKFPKPWFLAGGINTKNIEKAMAIKPFAVDISSGAETDGFKDREKILFFSSAVKGKLK